MKLKITAFFIAIVFACVLTARADSPLTSTEFYKAYNDEKIVRVAADADGILTEELMNYLIDSKNPSDVKMALINRLGWKFEGKKNSEIFLKFVLEKRKYSNQKKFLKKGKADELLAMAYLKALDNYFDVKEAAGIAEIALKKNPKSRTFNLITGLIKAQDWMDKNWCQVHQIVQQIKTDDKLTTDLKPEAIEIIYEYMDIYKDECK